MNSPKKVLIGEWYIFFKVDFQLIDITLNQIGEIGANEA